MSPATNPGPEHNEPPLLRFAKQNGGGEIASAIKAPELGGEALQKLRELDDNITLAESKFENKSDELMWTEKLYKKQYVAETKLKDYRLRLDTRNWQTITIPEISLKEGDEMYFGSGVSATVVNVDGQLMLLGTRAFTEAWDCVNAWVLAPISPSP